MVSKRVRDDSESESDAEVDEDLIANIVNVLLADSHARRPTKRATLLEVTNGSKQLRYLLDRASSILDSQLGLKAKLIPERTGKAPRHEYILISTLEPDMQKIAAKYTARENIIYEAKARLTILMIIIYEDNVHEEKLVNTLVGLGLFEGSDQDHKCQMFLNNLQTLRLVEMRRESTQNTARNVKIYSVGPLAALIYSREKLIEEIKKIMQYNQGNQLEELEEQNEQHIRDLVEKAISTA